MSKSFLLKAVIRFFIPVIIIIIAGKFNIWLGIATFLVYMAAIIILSRATIFALMGSRNYSVDKTELAIQWFKRAHDTGKAKINVSTSYAYILLKNENPDQAEEVLSKLLKDNPRNQNTAQIKSILGLVLWKKGDLDAAVAMLEEVIEVYKTTSVYGSLGYLLLLQGNLEKALQFNLEAYDYNSSDKIIQDNLGQNYYLMGEYEKSKEIYKGLIEKAPTFPVPYYNYGLLLEELGDQETAQKMFKKALDYKFSYLSTISRDDVLAKIGGTGEFGE